MLLTCAPSYHLIKGPWSQGEEESEQEREREREGERERKREREIEIHIKREVDIRGLCPLFIW